ncbi:hypothetical protein [Streptomyces sp. NPDC056361]|uniref:hypothetical protein n=1 Tax=Streptomyces sp. NPDC056361 TaxID=3345795 RepID=UPI0035DB95A9
MNLRKKTGAAVGMFATVASLVLLGSGSALAGSSGQQLSFHDRVGNTYSVWVDGHNQSGQAVARCFDSPSRDNYWSGWWWTSNVEVTGYSGGCGGDGRPTGNVTFSSSVWVPLSQSSDWTTFSN